MEEWGRPRSRARKGEGADPSLAGGGGRGDSPRRWSPECGDRRRRTDRQPVPRQFLDCGVGEHGEKQHCKPRQGALPHKTLPSVTMVTLGLRLLLLSPARLPHGPHGSLQMLFTASATHPGLYTQFIPEWVRPALITISTAASHFRHADVLLGLCLFVCRSILSKNTVPLRQKRRVAQHVGRHDTMVFPSQKNTPLGLAIATAPQDRRCNIMQTPGHLRLLEPPPLGKIPQPSEAGR